MDESIFIEIRQATCKAELINYLYSSQFIVRRYAKERLRELKEDIFDLSEVV